jgi:hypothetical protein
MLLSDDDMERRRPAEDWPTSSGAIRKADRLIGHATALELWYKFGVVLNLYGMFQRRRDRLVITNGMT